MGKLVSIIVPTYNYVAYIRGAVESALAQTYRPVEIIVVDDGSTDNIKEVLSDYIASDKINYIYQENKGLAGARNTGINASRGDYICFLDSDDLIHEKKTEIQVKSLEENPEYGVAFSDFSYIRDHDLSSLIPANVKYSGELNFSKIISGEYMVIHAALIRREVFERVGYFDESLRKCEDYDFWLRIAMKGIRFLFIDQVLAYYRLHEGQMVQDKIGVFRTNVEVINRYREYDRKSAEMALGKYGIWLGRHLIYNDRMKEGRKCLKEYMWYRKDKVIRMISVIGMSYLFSGKTIRKITDRKKDCKPSGHA